MKIKKVDDKPMVIHTKEKAKIHSLDSKGARIKGSNIYTVECGPKIDGAKVAETTGEKSYRKSIVHQVNVKENDFSRFKRNVKEAFARLEQLRKKGTVTDDDAELASYREDKYGR